MNDREDGEHGMLGGRGRAGTKMMQEELQPLSPEDSQIEDDDDDQYDIDVAIRPDNGMYAPVNEDYADAQNNQKKFYWMKVVALTMALTVLIMIVFGGNGENQVTKVPRDRPSWYRPPPKSTNDGESEPDSYDGISGDHDDHETGSKDEYNTEPDIELDENSDEEYHEDTEDIIAKGHEGTNDENVAAGIFEKPRIVFFAGPQRAGHEVMENAIATACKGSVKCKRLCAMSHPELWFPRALVTFASRRKKAVDELRQIATEGRKDTIYFVNLYGDCNRQDGFPESRLAYPQREMHYSSDHFPQVPEMQRIADEAGGGLEIRAVFLVQNSSSTENLVQQMISRSPFSKHIMSLYIRSAFEALFAQLFQMKQDLYRGFDMLNMKFAGKGTLDDFVGLSGLTEHLSQKIGAFQEIADRTGSILDNARYHLLTLDPLLTVTWKTLENGGYSGVKPKRVPGPVKKTVFHTPDDPKPIVFFMVGLEGTGHHLWRSIFSGLIKNEHALGIKCALQQRSYDHTSMTTLFHSDNLPHYERAVDKMKELLESIANDPGAKGVSYPINMLQTKVVCNSRSGMLSYPNFSGIYKNIQRGDMILLSRLMEEAGIDFRFIIMNRDSNAVIKSTVDNRSFGTAPHQIKVLESNAYAILAQTAAVDKAFMPSCIQYEDTDFNYVESLAKGFNVNATTLRRIASNNIHYHKSQMHKDVNLREEFESSMHATTAATKEFCPNKLVNID